MQTSASLLVIDEAPDLFCEDGVRLDPAEQEPDDGAHVSVAGESELPDEPVLRLRQVDREALDVGER